jgi:hypothetical protein
MNGFWILAMKILSSPIIGMGDLELLRLDPGLCNGDFELVR